MIGQHAATTYPRQDTDWDDGIPWAFIQNDRTVQHITNCYPTEPTWVLL